MPRGRTPEPVVSSVDEKTHLLGLANSRSLPHGLVQRTHIVLACAEGEPNASIVLRPVDAGVPEHFDVHLIADNYATHKRPKVEAWLARPALPHPLHPDPRLVAQSGRALVRPQYPESHPARVVLQRQGTRAEDRALRRALQHQSEALR